MFQPTFPKEDLSFLLLFLFLDSIFFLIQAHEELTFYTCPCQNPSWEPGACALVSIWYGRVEDPEAREQGKKQDDSPGLQESSKLRGQSQDRCPGGCEAPILGDIQNPAQCGSLKLPVGASPSSREFAAGDVQQSLPTSAALQGGDAGDAGDAGAQRRTGWECRTPSPAGRLPFAPPTQPQGRLLSRGIPLQHGVTVI